MSSQSNDLEQGHSKLLVPGQARIIGTSEQPLSPLRAMGMWAQKRSFGSDKCVIELSSDETENENQDQKVQIFTSVPPFM